MCLGRCLGGAVTAGGASREEERKTPRVEFCLHVLYNSLKSLYLGGGVPAYSVLSRTAGRGCHHPAAVRMRQKNAVGPCFAVPSTGVVPVHRRLEGSYTAIGSTLCAVSCRVRCVEFDMFVQNGDFYRPRTRARRTRKLLGSAGKETHEPVPILDRFAHVVFPKATSTTNNMQHTDLVT